MRGIAAAVLSLLIGLALCVPVLAQVDEPQVVEEKARSAEWPGFYVPAPEEDANYETQSVYTGIATINLKHWIGSPLCPDKSWAAYEMNFPGNTGSHQVDLQLRQYANGMFVKATNRDYWGWDLDNNDEDCEEPDRMDTTNIITYFVLSKPSEKYLSVLFYEYRSVRPEWGYKAFNFDLVAGRALDLSDLFLSPEKNIAAFENYKNKHFCQKFPDVWGCDSKSSDGAPSASCKGEFVLTGQGMTIVCGPYDGGSLGMGNKELDIPRADLIKLGVNPAFWQN